MLFSKSSVYGLRALVYLASLNTRDFVTISKLSGELNISFHFLTKVLQKLTKSEILESCKGPNGGVKLAKKAKAISFLDIVHSIDDNYTVSESNSGLSMCDEMEDCTVNEEWQNLIESLRDTMAAVTLEELALNQNRPPVTAPDEHY